MIRRIITIDEETCNGYGLRAKPCCGGLGFSVKTEVELSGKEIPLSDVTISPNGQIQR